MKSKVFILGEDNVNQVGKRLQNASTSNPAQNARDTEQQHPGWLAQLKPHCAVARFRPNEPGCSGRKIGEVLFQGKSGSKVIGSSEIWLKLVLAS